MKLNINKPLVVFDLETTGLDLVNDRIIQISYIKVMPNGEEKRASIFVNPGKPIPPLVQELTGITNERVKDEKTFKEIAKDLEKEFTGCDFAGFNSNRFDVPMLAEEFLRAGVGFDFSKCRLIDAQTIYHKREPRNLAAAYRFYTGHKMDDDFQAHRADQDAEATYRVLMGQLDKYAPNQVEDPAMALPNDMDVLAEESRMNNNVDFAGRIVWHDMVDKDGKPVLDKDGKPRRLRQVQGTCGQRGAARGPQFLQLDHGQRLPAKHQTGAHADPHARIDAQHERIRHTPQTVVTP